MRESYKSLILSMLFLLLSAGLICISANYEELRDGFDLLSIIPAAGSAWTLVVGLLALGEGK